MHSSQTQVEEISAEWRLTSHRLKEEPHHLWYLLKHILASKFTYLFRGTPPGFAQLLADCLTQLHRETCEILAQCETIPDISFDLARIREAGLGYADDLLDSASAASKIASLRSIEQVNPGFLDSAKEIFAAGTTEGQDYSGLRKLQSVFLAPQKVVRTAVVEDLLRPNSVHNTIYQSGKSPEARAWLDAIPKTEALTMSPSEFRTALLSESVAHPSSPVVSPHHLCLWSGRGRPWCPYPEVPTRR